MFNTLQQAPLRRPRRPVAKGGEPETIDVRGPADRPHARRRRAAVRLPAQHARRVVPLAAVLRRAGPSTSPSTSRRIRGSAPSGGFDDIDSIEDMAFHYVELFDALGLDEVVLGGVSLGGWIAAEFAVPLAERVKKLWIVRLAGPVGRRAADARPVPPPRRPAATKICANCCSTTRRATWRNDHRRRPRRREACWRPTRR